LSSWDICGPWSIYLGNSGLKRKRKEKESKESTIQENWKKCYIVELVVGFFEDVYCWRQ
jgi:hypothetical protein